jgi:hypothetical protein
MRKQILASIGKIGGKIPPIVQVVHGLPFAPVELPQPDTTSFPMETKHAAEGSESLQRA